MSVLGVIVHMQEAFYFAAFGDGSDGKLQQVCGCESKS